jgi:multidrug efflux system outer membrane protein
MRELDYELDISKRTLASRQESLRLISLRQQRGVSTMLEVRQAEELVYDATEVIPHSNKESSRRRTF